MIISVLIGSVLGVPIGLVLGWAFHFAHCYLQKKNLRWTWLLCKPTQLSEAEMSELASFY